MKFNNLLLLIFSFCFTNLIGVRITNNTGRNIWINLTPDLSKFDADELNKYVEIKNGQFIDIENKELNIWVNTLLIKTNLSDCSFDFLNIPEIMPNNLTIIWAKGRYYCYDETKEEAPIFEDEDDEGEEVLNQNSNIFTWKTALFGVAAIGITYFIFKSISNDKKENNKQ